MGSMDKPETCILRPKEAALAGATLRGYIVSVRELDGTWTARVSGELMLPDGSGKQTPQFERSARDATVAAATAIEDCRLAYWMREAPSAPTPMAG